MIEIKPGRYRHFKGNEYEVIGIAKHSETTEEMVVYRAIYGEHGLWIRPASMWNEMVEHKGQIVRRFSFCLNPILHINCIRLARLLHGSISAMLESMERSRIPISDDF